MHRRTLLALIVFALSIAIVTSSGSFTSASVERGTSVVVVEDENAFIGVETIQHELDNGNHEVVLMKVTNRFDSDVEEVLVFARNETEAPPPILTNASAGTIENDTVIIKGHVTCANATRWGEVPVQLTIQTGETTVKMTRRVAINCTGEPPKNNADESNITE